MQNIEEQIKKEEESSLFSRRDGGEIRLVITTLFLCACCCFLYFGQKLIQSGTTGNWQIVSSFDGWTLYITSISPGLFVILAGAVIIIWGLPKTLKAL